MKTKKLRVEYFLLMGIAFLFQSIVKNDVVFTSKTISSYFSYEDNKSKVLYGFILEFQQKVEAFGIKKNKDIKKGIPIFTNPFEKLFSGNSYDETESLKKNRTLAKDYKANTFLIHLGIEEKMYMSSYLV